MKTLIYNIQLSKALIIVVLFTCLSQSLTAQTYCLKFDFVKNGSTVDLKLGLIASGTGFNLGSSNLQVRYKKAALGSPTLISNTLKATGKYSGITLTQPTPRSLDGTGDAIVSFNLNFIGDQGEGLPISLIGTDIAVIRFQVQSDCESPNIRMYEAGTAGTVVFDDKTLPTYLASSGNCPSITSAISTVNFGTIPTICAGATSFAIPFTSSNPTTVYSISGTGIISVTDATAMTSPITVNLSSAASAGFIPYSLKVKNSNGCPESIITGSVAVNSPPNAVITLTGASSFCQGGSTKLTASGGTSYAWSTGATTADITATEAQTYTVTVTNSNGCTKTASQNITVNPLPNAAINLNGSSTICQGNGVQLTASGGTNYAWSTGATSADIVATEAKIYTVTVSNGNGCSKTATQSINVNPSPNATIALNGASSFCQGGSTKLTASGGTSYTWSNGATAAEITATESNTYTVTVSNGTGCTKGASQIITVNPTPNAAISLNGASIFCQGGSVLLTASGGTSYAWSTGASAAQITATESKTYTVTVSNDKGCSKTVSQSITVNSLPDAKISGSNTFCTSSSTILTASGGNKFQWSNGITTAENRVSTEGVYSVIVTNENNCSASTNITIKQGTSLQATIQGNKALCSGSSTSLTAFGGDTFKWSTGATTPTIIVNQAGNYSVTVTDNSGCIGTARETVLLSPSPVATINGNSEICENANSTTNLSATGGVSYKWSNGQNASVISIATAGNYSVTVTDANGCTASASKTVSSVSVNGVISVLGNSTICAGESVKLRASGGTSYLWSDGTSNAEINASDSKTYSVTVSNSSGCTNVVTQNIIVNPLPNALVTPTGATSFCQGNSVRLVASGGLTYNWSNNATSSEITVSQSGNYSVTVTNANRCSRTVSQLITVNALPDAKILGSNTFCTGSGTILTASGGNKFQWSNGITTAENRVSTEGVYSVIVTNENNCSAIANISVKQGTSLQVTIQGAKALCSGSSTSLTALGGDTFKWSTGATTPTITVNQVGNYSVTVTNGSGCTGEATQTIVLGQVPNVIISGNGEICELSTGIVATALEAKGGVSYKWSSGQTTAYIPVSVVGDYAVTVTDANGCSTIAYKTVIYTKVNGKIEVIGNSTICSGQKVTLKASGGTLYLWSNGQTTSEISVTPLATTEYAAVAITGTCTDIIKQTIKVYGNPVPIIEGIGEICENLNALNTTILTAKGGNTYKWSTGETTASITVNNQGEYAVTITDINGCVASTLKKVSITKMDSKITVRGSTNICRGEQVRLGASGGTSYLWSTGATGSDILVVPTETTEYSVTVSSNACNQIKKQIITIVPKPKADFEFFVGRNNKVKFVNTTIGANTFSWIFEAGLTSTLENPEIEFKNSGDHYVCLTASVSETCGDVKCVLLKTTSIQELPESLTATVSPNPANDFIEVKMNFYRPFRPDERIIVYDLLGRKVHEIMNLSTSNRLEIGHFTNGIYILRITIDGKTYTLDKVVKSS